MTARTNLTWSGIFARRMARSHLTEPARGATPADIATALVGVHAQVMSAAELSIGRRIAGATRSDVQRALADHSLIKTFGPRGTVHLVAADDLPMWTGALSALPSGVPNHPDPVRFTADESAVVVAAIGDALGNGPLTVDELTDALEARLGAWAVERTMDAFQVKWPRWRQLTSIAAHRGVLCFGPDRGRNVTYASPQAWLPAFRPDDGERASLALLRRYLSAYGPATSAHFARWLAIPAAAAADLFRRSGDGLQEVDLSGERAWVVAGDTGVPEEPPPGVRLLPYFDAYVIAGQPRERLFPGAAATRAMTRGGVGNYPVMLVGGVVGGVWHQRRSDRRVAITVEPLRPLSRTQRGELEAEVDLVGRVLEATPSLTIGTVTVGPHA